MPTLNTSKYFSSFYKSEYFHKLLQRTTFTKCQKIEYIMSYLEAALLVASLVLVVASLVLVLVAVVVAAVAAVELGR